MNNVSTAAHAAADPETCARDELADTRWLGPRADRMIRRYRRRRPAVRRASATAFCCLAVLSLTCNTATAPVQEAKAAVEAPSLAKSRTVRGKDRRVAALDSMMLRPPVIEPSPLGRAAGLFDGFKPVAHVPPPLLPPVPTPQVGALPDPREPVTFGSVTVPRRIVELILRAAAATDVDPVYLMALADKESGFIPDAQAPTSSAAGMFQFIEATWLETVKTFGARHGLAAEAARIEFVDDRAMVPSSADRERILALRHEPYLAAVMAAEMLKRHRAEVGFRIGRDLKPSEFYLPHFLGPQGAGQLLELAGSKPRENAAEMFPAAARANKSIFFEKTQKTVKKGKKTITVAALRGATVDEVYRRLDRMIDRRLDRYEPVAAMAASVRVGSAD